MLGLLPLAHGGSRRHFFFRKQAPYWIFIELFEINLQCWGTSSQDEKKDTKKIKAITQSCLAMNQTLVGILS